MIKSLMLKNFQSHKSTDITFSKGVNVIVGSSDSGKSAIIRALRWIVTNRPSGDSFRSHWGGDETFVSIEADKAYIERCKSKSKNVYYIGEEEQKAIGTDVPADVREVLNMDDINIQHQHDAPFMLSESAGEVARYLNQVVDLSQIDNALYKAESLKRESKRNIEGLKEYLKGMEQSLADYANLSDLEKAVKRCEILDKEIAVLSSKEISLQALITNISHLYKDLKGFKDTYPSEESLTALQQRCEALAILSYKIERLKGAAEQLERDQTTLLSLKERICLDEATFKKLMPDICPLCGRGGEHEC